MVYGLLFRKVVVVVGGGRGVVVGGSIYSLFAVFDKYIALDKMLFFQSKIIDIILISPQNVVGTH